MRASCSAACIRTRFGIAPPRLKPPNILSLKLQGDTGIAGGAEWVLSPSIAGAPKRRPCRRNSMLAPVRGERATRRSLQDRLSANSNLSQRLLPVEGLLAGTLVKLRR